MNTAMSPAGPRVSIIVVLNARTEQLEDTLHCLSVSHQRHVTADDYEILLMEDPPGTSLLERTKELWGINVRHLRAPGSASLAFVMEQARAPLVGFLGASYGLVTPRLVEHLLAARRLYEHPAVFVPEYRIVGIEGQTPAQSLEAVDWRKNGYALLEVSRFCRDSYPGFFGPLAGTNTTFLSKQSWLGEPAARSLLLAGEGIFCTSEESEPPPFATPPSPPRETPLVIGVIAPEGQKFIKQSAALAHARHLAPKRPVDTDDPLGRARRRYVELLERSLLGTTQLDDELRIRYLLKCIRGEAIFDRSTLHDIRTYDPNESMRFAISKHLGSVLDGNLENLGFDHTMVGKRRLENIEECFHSIMADGVQGDLMECGVWRGGGVVLMRGLLEAYEVPDRFVWVADSFQGLPSSSLPEDLAHGDLSRESYPMLAVDLETVKRTFDLHGLLDDRVRFLPGWFKDTLPSAPIERLALLRLDGDLYESTRDTLVALYDKLSPGGFLIVDDLFLPTCRRAIDDFRAARGIEEPIVPIDWTGGYWRKAR